MEENDELWFDELKEDLDATGSYAKQATYEVIRDRATKLENYFRNSAPVKTGKLRGSVVKTQVEVSDQKIKFKVEFKGYNEKGEPFQTIANTLNRGFAYRNGNRIIYNSGTHFIDDGVRDILTGIDEEIEKRFNELAGGE